MSTEMEVDDCDAVVANADEMPIDLSVKKKKNYCEPETVKREEPEPMPAPDDPSPAEPVPENPKPGKPKPEEPKQEDGGQPEHGLRKLKDKPGDGEWPWPATRTGIGAPVSRPSIVIAPAAAKPNPIFSKPLSVVSPQIANPAMQEQRAPVDGDRSASASDSPRPSNRPPPFLLTGGCDPFLAAATAAWRATSAMQPLLLCDHPFLTDRPYLSGPSARLDRQLQQQQLDLVLQQQQLQLQQQQQQLRFQQQLQQHQQHLQETFGGHRGLDFDSSVLACKLNSDPLYAAAPPSPTSSVTSESNSFSYGGGCMHVTSRFGYSNNNTYSYLDGLSGDSRSDGRFSPGLTVTADDDFNVNAEDVADIYRTSEFLSFRQRYMDSLGPPRNYEKMRRSMPANKRNGGGGQPPAFDVMYAQKRMKNNEAAKKSRDAKRQKFLENQISVMYLTKKIREMNDLKRRLLMSME